MGIAFIAVLQVSTKHYGGLAHVERTPDFFGPKLKFSGHFSIHFEEFGHHTPKSE
jgi:hypothetical protein